jgi:hypothetical protein
MAADVLRDIGAFVYSWTACSSTVYQLTGSDVTRDVDLNNSVFEKLRATSNISIKHLRCFWNFPTHKIENCSLLSVVFFIK